MHEKSALGWLHLLYWMLSVNLLQSCSQNVFQLVQSCSTYTLRLYLVNSCFERLIFSHETTWVCIHIGSFLRFWCKMSQYWYFSHKIKFLRSRAFQKSSPLTADQTLKSSMQRLTLQRITGIFSFPSIRLNHGDTKCIFKVTPTVISTVELMWLCCIQCFTFIFHILFYL